MTAFRTEPILSRTVSGILPDGERNRRVGLASVVPREPRKPVPTREVVCYECGKASEVPAAALSATCIHCHAHLNMADKELKPGTKHLTIRTLGDVTAPPDTVLSHTTIVCRHFTMYGRVSGTFRVSGVMTIGNSVRIEAPVKAKRLIINKDCRVVFCRGVEVSSIDIAGTAEGDIHCSGELIIRSTGRLEGDCHAAERRIEQGGSQEGIFTRISPVRD